MSKFSRRFAGLVLVAGLAAFVMIGVAGPGHRFGLWGWNFVQQFLFLPGMLVAGGAVVLGVIWLVAGLIRKDHRGGRNALIGVVLAVLAATPLLLMLQTARSVPFIHDISTDTVAPPDFVALAEARKASKNGLDYQRSASVSGTTLDVPAEQAKAYPDIVTHRSNATPAALYARALTVVQKQGWEIVAADPSGLRIEATATSFWFGFKDDVVIVIAMDGTGARLDIRSASREGLSDLGANAARIRAFLAEMSAAPG